jgi:hypothetical protein
VEHVLALQRLTEYGEQYSSEMDCRRKNTCLRKNLIEMHIERPPQNTHIFNAYNSPVNNDGILYFTGIAVECYWMIMSIA